MSRSNASQAARAETIHVHPNDMAGGGPPPDFDDLTKWVFVQKSSVGHPHSRRNPHADFWADPEGAAGFYARIDNPTDIRPSDPAFAPIAAARRLGEKVARYLSGSASRAPTSLRKMVPIKKGATSAFKPKGASSSSSTSALKPKGASSSSSTSALKPKGASGSSSSAPRFPSDFEKEMVVGLRVDAVWSEKAADGKLHYYPGVVRETRLAHLTGPNRTYEMDVRIRWDGTGPSAPTDWVFLHKVRHHQPATDFNTFWVEKWAGVETHKAKIKEQRQDMVAFKKVYWTDDLRDASSKKGARATGGVMSSTFKGKGLSSAAGGK
ncbi:hypothetical protein T484DRAFT_1867322 [Baffinella frigidus]|nr:hypothetical protein T484DRAFT_1867322 [Cryptophyta sp. CCMP2293]